MSAVRRRAPAGFTLLEIAVALAILGVGIVSCLQIFGASLRMQDRASRESRAVLAARGAMDALLKVPEIQDHSGPCKPEEPVSAEGFGLNCLVRHANAEDGLPAREFGFESENSLRYLQVDVAWEDGNGRKTYTLKSLRMAPEDEDR